MVLYWGKRRRRGPAIRRQFGNVCLTNVISEIYSFQLKVQDNKARPSEQVSIKRFVSNDEGRVPPPLLARLCSVSVRWCKVTFLLPVFHLPWSNVRVLVKSATLFRLSWRFFCVGRRRRGILAVVPSHEIPELLWRGDY